MPLAFLPSPARAVWHLGPVPLRAQALCVVAGILVALAITARRYRKAGGPRGVVVDVAAWAVTAALVPAVIGALLSGPQPRVLAAIRAWDEAIGFPGAVALGLAGAWLGCRSMRVPRALAASVPPGSSGILAPRRRGKSLRIRLTPIVGAAAPALLYGHAVAEVGRWLAQRGYGKPSALWWAVEISPAHRAPGLENFATFQPVFAYQALWGVALGIAITWAAHRFALPGGQVLALACAGYCAAVFALSWLAIGHSPVVLGLRATSLGAVALFVAAVAYLARTRLQRGANAQVTGKAPLERSRPVM